MKTTNLLLGIFLAATTFVATSANANEFNFTNPNSNRDGDFDFSDDWDRGGPGRGDRDNDHGRGRDRDRHRDRDRFDRPYSVIFCMDSTSPCRKWDSYGRGNERSRSIEWHFSGNYRRDINECYYLAQAYRGRKHGVNGLTDAHMFSDGNYNPITSPQKLFGRQVDIEDYCRRLVSDESR